MGLFKPNIEKLESKGDTEGLFKALQHRDGVIRERAAAVLDRLGWQPADDTEKAHYLLAKGEWDELAELGGPAVELIIKALQDTDEETAKLAQTALERMALARPPSAMEPLIKALQISGIRRHVAKALGVIGDTRAVEPMIQILREQGSGQVYNKSTGVLLSDSISLAPSVVEGLALIGEPAVEPLIQALKKERGGARVGAAEALGEIGDGRAVEPLIQILQDTGSGARERTINALGTIGGERARQALTQALKDRDSSVRDWAAKALKKLGAVEPEVPADALEDRAAIVPRRAVEIEDAEAVDPQVQALEEESRGLDVTAARSLVAAAARDRSEIPLHAAFRLMESKDVKDRRAAAQVLSGSGDSLAIGLLVRALRRETGVLRHARTQITAALVQTGDPAVPPLIQALKDPNALARKAVAHALGEIGDARALGPLVELLQDTELIVQQTAAEALGKMGDAQAVPPLVRALKDENLFVQKAAIQALAKVGDGRAIQPLTPFLKHKEDAIRIAARKAVGEIQARTPSQVVCPGCGKQLGPDKKFCTACGAKLH